MKKTSTNKGFTLIEILVVIGIIAILATIVIIAINPSRQFAQARNTQRLSNINTILNAIGQNIADNKGVWKCSTSAGAAVYFKSSSPASSTIGTSGTADLSNCLSTYIAAGVPVDPDGGTMASTGYEISSTTTGIITICAPKSKETALGSPTELCVTR